MLIHGFADRTNLKEKIGQIMEKVGLSQKYMTRYPHEFSGGQRQRIGIARALALKPSYVVCDEPISALDVSIQAQIINLLQHLQEENNISMLFISHDLNVVKHLSHRRHIIHFLRLSWKLLQPISSGGKSHALPGGMGTAPQPMLLPDFVR